MTLKRLDLRACDLTSQDAKCLAIALISNTHLEDLNINDNKLCDDGIQHLAHALRRNQHLKKLELASCGITDVGLECLVKSLEDNKVLTLLNVCTSSSERENVISEKIIPILIKCLSNNCTLTRLLVPIDLFNTKSVLDIEEAVNEVRKNHKRPLIAVEGMSSNYSHEELKFIPW